jgi:hypothetical protein
VCTTKKKKETKGKTDNNNTTETGVSPSLLSLQPQPPLPEVLMKWKPRKGKAKPNFKRKGNVVLGSKGWRRKKKNAALVFIQEGKWRREIKTLNLRGKKKEKESERMKKTHQKKKIFEMGVGIPKRKHGV